jgi:hypothetical protein
MNNQLPGTVYLGLLCAVQNMEQELEQTTTDPEKLRKDIQSLYDMINSYQFEEIA